MQARIEGPLGEKRRSAPRADEPFAVAGAAAKRPSGCTCFMQEVEFSAVGLVVDGPECAAEGDAREHAAEQCASRI